MIEVTQEQFFAVIGPQNVTPYPTGRYGQHCDGYRSYWKTPSGEVRGMSEDGPDRFYLPESPEDEHESTRGLRMQRQGS